VADLEDIRLYELGRRVSLSRRSGIAATSLPEHVLHVVGLGPGKQMSRVDTRWVVAGMENVQAFRYGTVVLDLPGDSMGIEPTSLTVDLPLRVEASVALREAATYPEPAVVWAGFVNTGPGLLSIFFVH